MAGSAGSGGFDGGVQRQKLDLSGDVLNEFNDVTDFLSGIAECCDFGVGLPCAGYRRTDRFHRMVELSVYFRDRCRKFSSRRSRSIRYGGGFMRTIERGLGIFGCS